MNEFPTVGFYRELHDFLKKWSPSCSKSATTIGNFYLSIDPELQHKSTSDNTRPDDIYRYIEKVVTSRKSNSTQMSYGINATVQRLQQEVNGYSAQIQVLTAKLLEQGEELSWMRKEVKLVLSELGQTKQYLKDIVDEMQVVKN